MAKFSIMLFGIDSYTKENLYLPYNTQRAPTLSSLKMESRTWRW